MGVTGGLAAIVGRSRTPRADIALVLAVGGFAALILWEAEKIPPPFFDPLGSAAVPRGIAVILIVLSAIALLRALVALPWPAAEKPQGYRLRPDIAVGIAVVALAYVAAMQLGLLGFRTATVAFVALSTAILGRFRPSIMAIGLVIGLVIGFGGAFVFTRVFFIALP